VFDSPGFGSYLVSMSKKLILLLGIILLYLAPSVILQFTYGPSYGFMSGEDSWIAGDNGTWVKHGNPQNPMPTEPSVQVPILVRYIPIFLPAVLLILFYLTPLSRKLEPDKPEKPIDQVPDSPPPSDIPESDRRE